MTARSITKPGSPAKTQNQLRLTRTPKRRVMTSKSRRMSDRVTRDEAAIEHLERDRLDGQLADDFESLRRECELLSQTPPRRGSRPKMSSSLDFDTINRAALASLPALLRRWLPNGRLVGCEYAARNPTRADRRPGSFKVNTRTGRWADFATGDKGGDVVSLAAYLAGTSQVEAARSLARMLGLQP